MFSVSHGWAAGSASFSPSSDTLLHLTFQKKGGTQWVSLHSPWGPPMTVEVGHLSTFSGGHALCLKRFYACALLGTGIRLGSLEGRGNGTELLQIKEEHESECGDGRGEKAAAGPCLGVCSLLWVNPLLSDIFNTSSSLPSARNVSRGF